MTGSFLCRLPVGEDLLETITKVFRERGLRKAAFNVIGAVTRAALAYYDSELRQYKNREFEGLLEIVSCSGNVSERDGEVFVHAHMVLAGENFACVGGHLMPGTVIFAAELYGTPVPGSVPVRQYDDFTGLFLWTET